MGLWAVLIHKHILKHHYALKMTSGNNSLAYRIKNFIKSIHLQQSTNTPAAQEIPNSVSINFTGIRMRLISFSLDTESISDNSGYRLLHISKEYASAEPDKCPMCLYTMSSFVRQPNSGSFRSVLMAGVQISSGPFSFFSVCGCGNFMRVGIFNLGIFGNFFFTFFFFPFSICAVPCNTSLMSKTISVGR